MERERGSSPGVADGSSYSQKAECEGDEGFVLLERAGMPIYFRYPGYWVYSKKHEIRRDGKN
jgi:hypothetical protein